MKDYEMRLNWLVCHAYCGRISKRKDKTQREPSHPQIKEPLLSVRWQQKSTISGFTHFLNVLKLDAGNTAGKIQSRAVGTALPETKKVAGGTLWKSTGTKQLKLLHITWISSYWSKMQWNVNIWNQMCRIKFSWNFYLSRRLFNSVWEQN